MNQETRKGFVDFLALALGVIAIVGIGTFYFKSHKADLGATVLTTNLSDTIGTFRTNVNTSLSNLNADIASITSTQSTYGTIVTENTPLASNKGGTGTTTTPTANQFLSANGTSPAWKTLASSTGIILTFGTTSTIIGTTGFDNTANIAFTGNNTHAGTETFNGTSTFNASTALPSSTTLAGQPLNLPIYLGIASSSVTSVSISGSSTSTVGTFSAPAVSSTDELIIESAVTSTASTNNFDTSIYINGTQLCSTNGVAYARSNVLIRMTIFMLASTSLQSYVCEFNGDLTPTSTFFKYGTASLNLGASWTASTTVFNGVGSAHTSTQQIFRAFKIKS